MNARIYDPLLGRFLSPDPEVTDEEWMQNYNRYAYVMNNPLSYTDPSGEFAVFAAPAVASQISGFMGAVAGLSIGAAIAESIDLVDGEAFDRIAADARLDSRSPKIGKPSSQSLDARQVGKAKPDVGGAYGEAPQKNESQVSESRQKKPLDAAQAKAVSRKPNSTSSAMGSPDPDNDGDDSAKDKNSAKDRKKKEKSVNQLQSEIKRGQAPEELKDVHRGKVKGEQTHAHFKDGSALNKDGSWKHRKSSLTKAVKDWLKKWMGYAKMKNFESACEWLSQIDPNRHSLESVHFDQLEGGKYSLLTGIELIRYARDILLSVVFELRKSTLGQEIRRVVVYLPINETDEVMSWNSEGVYDLACEEEAPALYLLRDEQVFQDDCEEYRCPIVLPIENNNRFKAVFRSFRDQESIDNEWEFASGIYLIVSVDSHE